MLGRILRSADFERVLGAAACARSAHFAVHYLAGMPTKPQRPRASPLLAQRADESQLSTDDEQNWSQLVDDSPPELASSPQGKPATNCWLGSVVPKRHARRAVTRSLLKRQIRAAALRCDAADSSLLRPGMWVVRLRAGFDRADFGSAASQALRRAARDELDALLRRAALKLDSAGAGGTSP